MTKEELIKVIDGFPSWRTGEYILKQVVCGIMLGEPQLVSDFMTDFNSIANYTLENMIQALQVSKERAEYLSTYLGGNMYSEEVAKRPEYIEIQKCHADTIIEKCAQTLGIKKVNNEN